MLASVTEQLEREELTWRDAVHTDVVFSPLSTKRLAKLDNASLGCVIARLLLRVVHDRARHGCNQDDRSGLVGCDHRLSNCLRNEERASQVDIYQTTEHNVVISLGWDVRTEELLVA
jgi:hypothetical protein